VGDNPNVYGEPPSLYEKSCGPAQDAAVQRTTAAIDSEASNGAATVVAFQIVPAAAAAKVAATARPVQVLRRQRGRIVRCRRRELWVLRLKKKQTKMQQAER
jgi:hypothetical protein